ncbi:MAG: hypothetical protein ACYC61_31095 [Isosphaeraceae bacterium]
MMSDPDQVVITMQGHPCLCGPRETVHHREFPEVRGEGDSIEDAAAHLAEMLERTLDSAPSDWRRQGIERAIEDVRAFANRDRR